MIKRILLAVFLIVAAWVGWELLTFPDVAALEKRAPETTSFMEIRKKELRREGKDDTLQWKWVPYGRISPHLRRAVLVAEDNQFYEHEGVDAEAMKEALERAWKRRKITHGGSTITQQLAKNLYLSPSRNPLRKVREYFIARSLENHLSKKRILEIYLNVVEFGERVYGAEAAARHYFGVPASALSPNQAALLAGSLPNPRVMVPSEPNKRLRARQRMILSRMRRWGYLIEKEVLTSPKAEAQSPVTPPTETVPSDTVEPVPPEVETETSPATGTQQEEAIPEQQPPPEPGPPATETPTTTTQSTATQPL